MSEQRHDLALVLRSRAPLIVIETADEARVLDMFRSIMLKQSSANYQPLFRWTITDGLQRLDIDLEPQALNSEPSDVLRHIRAVSKPGVYVLLDFHPFLDDPLHVRLLKDICIRYRDIPRQLVLISHEVRVPTELEPFCARVDMALPNKPERETIVRKVINEFVESNPGRQVQVDQKAHALLVENLAGLTYADTTRLARNAVFVDGAITKTDIPGVMQAKYDLLNSGGVLQFEYDTARFSDVGGLERFKTWLTRRKAAFRRDASAEHLDAPKGALLIGVQGCGKSLAAKATAGIFGVPLLRLDFANLYDKYHGETERKLREALDTAVVMSPCVLWIDEIEKGLAGRGGETGTAQRVLGSFLTWMAERRGEVFVVATANAIDQLPPELVRKGRFDEIFFVDLPSQYVRASIFAIHLTKRSLGVRNFDLDALAARSEGFSGAEIEQAIVAALYTAHAKNESLATQHILNEVGATRPLSVVMSEQIAGLRAWAAERTVPADEPAS